MLDQACSRYEWCPRLREEVERILGEDPVHGYPHVVRVAELALKISGMIGGVDEEVLLAAALVHDVGRPFENKREKHHAVISAEEAPALLRRAGFPVEKVYRVVEAVLAHSFSLGVRAESMEAKVLSDADKLDAMGAVGVARAFIEGDRRGRGFEGTVQHFEEKLLRLRELMYTEPGRLMAEERHRFMEMFLEKFLEEAGLKHVYSLDKAT